jgi:hypothetical protein
VSRNVGVVCGSKNGQPADERQAASRSLQWDIRERFGIIPVEGYYAERKGTPDEERVKARFYLVIGKKGNDSGNLKGYLRKLALKYDQEAVLLKRHDSLIAELHHRDGRVRLAGNWHPERISQYYRDRSPGVRL